MTLIHDWMELMGHVFVSLKLIFGRRVVLASLHLLTHVKYKCPCVVRQKRGDSRLIPWQQCDDVSVW